MSVKYEPAVAVAGDSHAAPAVARARVVELRRCLRALWPDADDPRVMSEITTLIAELRRAERKLSSAGVLSAARGSSA